MKNNNFFWIWVGIGIFGWAGVYFLNKTPVQAAIVWLLCLNIAFQYRLKGDKK